MSADADRIAFALSGLRSDGSPTAGGMRPTVLARYHDLAAIRHDYPVVLVGASRPAEAVRSLSEVLDATAAKVGGESDGPRFAVHAQRLESSIRRRLAGGESGRLAELIERAASETPDAEFASAARSLKAGLVADGELVDCGPELATSLVRHLWRTAEAGKRRRFVQDAERLMFRLDGILRAASGHTEAARAPGALRASVGTAFESAFDFDALSRVVGSSATPPTVSERRRDRIEGLLATIRGQRFSPMSSASNGRTGHVFEFDRVEAAIQAVRMRSDEAIALCRAFAIADLESEGRYDEHRHDAVFAAYGHRGLDPADAERLPTPFVAVNAAALTADEMEALLDVLGADVPIKVVVQTDDLLGRGGEGLRRVTDLAFAALRLANTFVVQASASELFRLRDRLAKAMATPGPALVCVYSGGAGSPKVAPYLAAVAATESRALPTYSYDPTAGADWRSRFTVADNPAVERDRVPHRFEYEGPGLARRSDDADFGWIELVALDGRFADAFWPVPASEEVASFVPASTALDNPELRAPAHLPFVYLVDDEDRLYRAIVENRLLAEAARCAERWRLLRELGGVLNSHARAAMTERDRAAEAAPIPAAEPATPPVEAPAVEAASSAAPSADEPYIETPRCTSCNECIVVNKRMFAYNANNQAYIADATAGTFRELVEAAEGCPVAIIHPGKPRDPGEEGLAALLERAAAFA